MNGNQSRMKLTPGVRGGLISFLLLAGLWTTPCFAADWARKMFETTSHDFGMIAAGAKAEFHFAFKNHLVPDVHVARVRSSCGCASVRVEKDTLTTYEKSAVIVSANSRSLRGRQSSTITVVFDRPKYAEVQLNINVYIRGDVVLEPASLVFGDVDLGTPADRTLTVTHYGNQNWRILDAKGTADYLNASLSEPVLSGSRVSYELGVTVGEGAPAGPIHEGISLTTTDGNDRPIQVMVQGRVVQEIRVGPATLSFGSLEPGAEATKRLIVFGKQPFRISSIEADCECFQFEIPDDREPKKMYHIPVKFKASDKPGGFAKRIYVNTDRGEKIASVVAYVNVKAPEE